MFTLTIQEFDTIVIGNASNQNEHNSKLSNRDKIIYIAEDSFNELKEYIETFQATENNSANVLDFFKLGYHKKYGYTITPRNYVGVIQLSHGKRIEILPKIWMTSSNEVSIKKTKEVFLNMLQSLDDFPCKNFNVADLLTDEIDIFEIFIRMYLRDVWILIKQGLKSAYTEIEDNLHYYKGKFLVSQNIHHNLGHQERFYVAYDEYNYNRPVNRIIKRTLEFLLRISKNEENTQQIRQLLVAFDQVDSSIHIDKDFAQIKIDRTMNHYESLIEWSKIFLHRKSFTPFADDTTAFSLLFPMEKLFESYIAKEFTTLLEKTEYIVLNQKQIFYLFNTPIPRFALRPDIVIKNKNETRSFILDTKWKCLINKPDNNYGISQNDMYQMYAYSKKYQKYFPNCKQTNSYLIYPQTQEMKTDINNITYKSDDAVTVSIFFVDLVNIEQSLNKFIHYTISKEPLINCF